MIIVECDCVKSLENGVFRWKMRFPYIRFGIFLKLESIDKAVMKTKYLLPSILLFITFMTVKAEPCENPFFEEWTTPYGAPPFSRISVEHYVPAFEKGIAEEKAEIQAIIGNDSSPSFENTIEALDKCGALINKVGGVFHNLVSADTSEALQEVDRIVTPMLTAHKAEIQLNAELFIRVKSVYDQIDSLELATDQTKLLEDAYQRFVRNGALLDAEQKVRYKEIVKELSVLMLQFGENVLKDTNAYEIIVTDESELAGVPSLIVQTAVAKAVERGYEGKWLFLPTRATVEPVTTYAVNRELRRKLFEGYTTCGDRGNEFDNNEIARSILNLRLEKANILGYKSHADYVLGNRMAKKADNVMELALKVWEPAIETAKKEIADMQVIIDAEGGDFKLAAWDYRYYAEKIRQERYALSEEALAPYFSAENVRKGIFLLVNRLYGVTITPEPISTYRPDVDAWKVTNEDGTHVGIFYSDYNLRDSKRAGAWMSAYRGQSVNEKGERIHPIIVNVCNFPNSLGDTPSLLSLDHVTTAFHEFGHATHGLFSNCRYESQAGTSVKTDFVELPSQLLENWAFEPELLKEYAHHYQTGEPIPDELIEKIDNSKYFNQGFFTLEYLAATLLDMEYHRIEKPLEGSISEFEQKILGEKYGLVSAILPRYRSTYFQHIFSGGYSAGYYSYLWAEVLDADAFDAFREQGVFNRGVARSFRENILSKGGSEDPMDLYLAFRGKAPSTEPLLRRRGFL